MRSLFLILLVATTQFACVDPAPRHRVEVPNIYVTPRALVQTVAPKTTKETPSPAKSPNPSPPR